MSGIRVSNIPREYDSEDLKIHFSNRENAGGKIEQIYFPLLNNDAVIFFRNADVVDLLLTREHAIDGHRIHVVRTEPMIFSKITAKLSPEISSLVSVSSKIKNRLLYVIEVELMEDPEDHCIELIGDMYQIELAWNTINLSLQSQRKIHSRIYQNQESLDGDRESTRSKPESPAIDGGTFTVHHDSLSNKMKVDTESQREESHHGDTRLSQRPSALSDDHRESSEGVIPKSPSRESVTKATASRSDRTSRDSVPSRKKRLEIKEGDTLSSRKTGSFKDDDDDPHNLSNTFKPIVHPITSNNEHNHLDLHETSPKLYDDEQLELELALQQSKQISAGHYIGTDYENIRPSAFNVVARDKHAHQKNVQATMLGDISDDTTEEDEIQKLFKGSRGSSDSERSRQANDTFKEFSSTTGTVYPFPQEKTDRTASLFSTDFSISSHQEFLIGNLIVVINLKSVTSVETDGLVNAANGSLSHAAGVAGAISRAAGVSMEMECEDYIRRNGHLRTTNVMHTSAGGRLKVRYILHAVGPIWIESCPERCTWELTKTYLNCFEYANSTLRISSISVPCISSGIFGAPLDTSIQCFVDALLLYYDSTQFKTDQYLKEIHMVNNDEDCVVTTIVIIQSLLEGGLQRAIQVAKDKFQELREKSEIVPTPRLYSNENTRPGSSTGSRVRRTSSLDRRPEKVKVDRHEFKTTTFRVDSQNSPGSKKSSSDAKKTTKSPVVKQTLTNPTSLRPKTAPSKAGKSKTDEVARLISEFGLTDDFDGMTSLPAHLSYPNRDDNCPICFDRIRLSKTLDKCGHRFCQRCIDRHFNSGKPVCPTCGMLYGIVKGDQPLATMSYKIDRSVHIPGYDAANGAIIIQYDVPAGIQMSNHPNPGKRYKALKRKAYLPNNTEGQEIYRLLRKAFDNKLIFTIGASRTTGKEDVVTWNDIHHKTSADGGPTKFGYPDPTYLNRVREELAAKGIV